MIATGLGDMNGSHSRPIHYYVAPDVLDEAHIPGLGRSATSCAAVAA